MLLESVNENSGKIYEKQEPPFERWNQCTAIGRSRFSSLKSRIFKRGVYIRRKGKFARPRGQELKLRTERQ
jgi:hypothetical protein